MKTYDDLILNARPGLAPIALLSELSTDAQRSINMLEDPDRPSRYVIRVADEDAVPAGRYSWTATVAGELLGYGSFSVYASGGGAIIIPPPFSPSLTVGYCTVIDAAGVAIPAASLKLQMTKALGGLASSTPELTMTADSSGVITQQVVRGCSYRVWFPEGPSSSFVAPTTGNSFEMPGVVANRTL